MQRVRTRVVIALAVCLGLLFVAGAAMAGAESVQYNKVRFALTDGSAYTYHTTDDPSSETAALTFKVAFDQAQSGYLQGVTIKLQYNPDYITCSGARLAPGWGTVTPNFTLIPGNPTRVIYIIDPVPGTSRIPIQQALTDLAFFDFQVQCQADPQVAAVQIIYGAAETGVDDGIDLHYVTDPLRIDNGSVSRWAPYWAAWMANNQGDVDYPGALGTVIQLPVIVGTVFRVASADMTFSYDVAKLQFVGPTDLEPSFTGSSVSYPASGQVRIQLATNEAVVHRHEFQSAVALKLNFRVLGNWQGGSTVIGWVGEPVFGIAQDAGTCATPFGYNYRQNCTIRIPAYSARFTTEFTDGGTLSLTDNQVSVMVNLTNNFPAGGAWKRIIANMCLGLSLEKSGFLTFEAINFGSFTYDGANGQELSLWTEPNPGSLTISETPQDMVAFNIRTVAGFTPPTSYENRFYPITYQTPFDSDPSYNANATDTTGRATLTQAAGNLTWDSPRVEYLMGEYYCNPVSAGQGNIAQDYFMRSSFGLHDFRVKIVVTGSHHMYDIAPQPGVVVESFDATNYKWAILKAGPGWTDQAPTDIRVKFASITYAYSGGSNLQMALDRPGPSGHWVTYSSTVAFEFNAGLGYYMKDPAGADQHEVAIGNSVVSSWWVNDWDYDDPRDNMALLSDYGIPVTYDLQQNYPNPFNPTTEFLYGLPEAGYVELCVFNITGQKVATLAEGLREAGYYRQTWDGTGLASGVYFYRLQVNDNVQTRKMILLK